MRMVVDIHRYRAMLLGSILGLLLAGCVSIRAPRTASELFATLSPGLEQLRELAAHESGTSIAPITSRRLEETCPPISAVGIRLLTEESPGGRLARTWEQLREAQRDLQLACGELEVLARARVGEPDTGFRYDRWGTVFAHLDSACDALKAVAASIDSTAYQC